MFLLMLLISLLLSLFCVPFLLAEKHQAPSSFSHAPGIIILSIGLWMLYFFLLHGFISHVIIGLFLLVFAFSRLGIYPLPGYFVSARGVTALHLILMAVISAMSGLPVLESLLVFLLFVPFTLLSVIVFKGPFKRYRRKKVENVKLLLELFSVLDGIFVFIITLIIFSDRVRFLEKIAHQVF